MSEITDLGSNTGNAGVNNYVIPAIGAVGIYNLASPYNTLINPNINYMCMAIRTIGELLANNQDPYALAYQPAGISQTLYQQAVSENMPIISLVSDGGNWVYIPANYILEIPLVNGINYKSIGINIMLGLMADSYNFSNLIDQLEQTILANTGINATVQLVQMSNSMQVTQEQASTIESARQANITNNNSIYGLYMNTLQALNAANQQIQAMQNYIMQNASVLGLTGTTS